MVEVHDEISVVLSWALRKYSLPEQAVDAEEPDTEPEDLVAPEILGILGLEFSKTPQLPC